MNQKQNFINELFKFITLLENSWDFIFSQVWLTVKNYQILYLISNWLDTSKSLLSWSYGSKPNMTKKIKFLEDNGFITRHIDTLDKRVFRFLVTKKGNDAMKKVSPIYENAICEIFDWISDTEMQIWQKIIDSCIQNYYKHCPND